MKRGESNLRRIRFYGYKTRRGVWFGVCLDFCIAAEADTPEELKRILGEMVESYLEVVVDTDDIASIRYLLNRKAPLRDWINYYLICCVLGIVKIAKSCTFAETSQLPAYGNC